MSANVSMSPKSLDPGLRRVFQALDRAGAASPSGKLAAPADLLERVRRGPSVVSSEPVAQRVARGGLEHVDPAAAKNADRALAARIDHTLLDLTTTPRDIERICEEAVVFGFRAVCVMPEHVAFAAKLLEGSGVGVACVIGFPAGNGSSAAKAAAARAAYRAGATEIDMVANTSALVRGMEGDSKLLTAYYDDVRAVAAASPATLKVILQTGLLRAAAAKAHGATAAGKSFGDELVHTASVLATAAMRDGGQTNGFIKTCDGIYPGAATAEDVAVMKRAVQGLARIKASGGVRSGADADALTEAGADIFGTSSGIKLVTAQQVKDGY